jgi:hypothetical protein
MSDDTKLREELRSLINRNSRENASGTPDYILAEYLAACLLAYDRAVAQRETWYGRPIPGDHAEAVASVEP